MTASAKKPVQGVVTKLRHTVAKLPRSSVVTITGVVAFAVIGTILLVSSHAATPTVSYESEAGTLSGAASIVSDPGASGGAGVKFGSGASTIVCDRNATSSTFSAQVAAATAGQTVCLANGNYGTWTGVNKVITVAAQPGATPVMNISFGSGDAGITLTGMTGMGGIIDAGAKNITITYSAFTSSLTLDNETGAKILIDHITSTNVDVGSNCQGVPAHIWIYGGGTSANDVIVSNSVISGGDADGIRPDAPSMILNNELYNIYENGPNDCAHTDGIQFYGGQGITIRGNYLHNAADGIVAYDGTANNTIENNVIDLVDGRYGIELYSDKNSVVRHNTLVYGTGCAYGPCGGIYLDHKSADPAGTGTVIENNIATEIGINNGSSAAVNRNNMLRSGASGTNFIGVPVFSGGARPATWAGFKLVTGSPGIGAASDGTNVGIN